MWQLNEMISTRLHIDLGEKKAEKKTLIEQTVKYEYEVGNTHWYCIMIHFPKSDDWIVDM